MAPFSKVLFALDNSVEASGFEKMCVDLLGREGYNNIIPGGRTNDLGRDAEIRVWEGQAKYSIPVVFQFSLEDDWERKLLKDLDKIIKHCPTIKSLVFVTSQDVTIAKQQKYRNQFLEIHNVDLMIYSREWLRHRLEEVHVDLANKYLGLDLPVATIPFSKATDLQTALKSNVARINGIDFEKLRTQLIEKTKLFPHDVDVWRNLAMVEYELYNYLSALNAVNRALEILPLDSDLMQAKGAILAEEGIKSKSRILLVQARDIFIQFAEKHSRAADHFNLANVLFELGEHAKSELHYRKALELRPNYAQAWKNLGSLLHYKGEYDNELDCYEKALAAKPNLIEAILCKATLLLNIHNKPDEAIPLFAEASAKDSSLDRKWIHWRYWYARALFMIKQYEKALSIVDDGLIIAPHEANLLNAKAGILHALWRADDSYRDIAYDYFNLRYSAFHDDYLSLHEILRILLAMNNEEEAWQTLEVWFHSNKHSIRQILADAEISIEEASNALKEYGRYIQYRRHANIEDYFTIMLNAGLSPCKELKEPLSKALAIIFCISLLRAKGISTNERNSELQNIFHSALTRLTSIISAFETKWLAQEAPDTIEKKSYLLATGIVKLPDIIAAEAGRQLGYIGGILNYSEDEMNQINSQLFTTLHKDTAKKFMEAIIKHSGWQLNIRL